MSLAIISPKKLSGSVTAPPSKSELHRAIICAALSRGVCAIYPIVLSNDVLATINAIKAFGASVEFVDGRLLINAKNMFTLDHPTIDCNESASTLRFLIPLASISGTKVTLTGSGTLSKRPIDTYLHLLPKLGVDIHTEDGSIPVTVNGKLKAGKIELPGNISSQFITGLLFVLPLLSSDSEIILTTPLESEGYVDMTISVMKKFSVKVEKTKTGFFIKGNQTYKATDYKTEGDWSSAAFWILAGALGGNIEISGLDLRSRQPDKNILHVMSRFGVRMAYKDNKLKVHGGSLKATDVYLAQFPDLAPVLAVTAAKAVGLTKIWGASRLKIKESNRIDSLCKNLKKMSVNTEAISDGLLVSGASLFKESKVDGFNDHRIVMAMAVAGSCAKGKITITDTQCVHKSYPEFFEDFEKLGGIVNIINI